MTRLDFGTQAVTAEDRAYGGSRFAEVVDALFENPYQKVWGRVGEPALPVQKVTFGAISSVMFRAAVARSVDSGADLRWGKDRKGFRRLLHPNGVCLIGRWLITVDTPYSGYFSNGSDALTIGRYSTCCADTLRGQTRSLALGGKLFPTNDPQHPTALRTANFLTQEDIGGANTVFINDAELRNAPDVTLSRRRSGVPILLVTGFVFGRVDKEPAIRQLYQIAELGKSAGEPTRAPEFMRLVVNAAQPRIDGAGLDFRDEVMAQIFDRGDPAPKRALTFDIDVTDEGSKSGPAAAQRRTFRNWRTIGTLTFDNAVVSYNGDRVLHFHHPTWRADRNNPATATRVNGRKVR